MMPDRLWAIIPAAGLGTRMRAGMPKQYLTIGGKAIIEYSMNVLLDHPRIDGMVVALAEDDAYWAEIEVISNKPIFIVNGGEQRCHSVLNALEQVQRVASGDDWVLVHDAARPCVRSQDISKLINLCESHPVGGFLATPARDTMKRGDEAQQVVATVDRERLWHALTPQMFRLKALKHAIEKALADQTLVTDESSALEYVGERPMLVEGHDSNIKVTRPEDLSLAAYWLTQIK